MTNYREPIAIIGIGCRFPGANGPKAFWQLLRDGVDAITEVPADRWNAESYYDPNSEIPDKMNTRWGGFLEQVDQFDSQFFGITPREAVSIDPQQRLLLEVTWEALEDAGQIPALLIGSPTGVFVGISSHDYSRLFYEHLNNDIYALTGNSSCMAANRISYQFDFRGPSLAINTACSSSLVAVDLACRNLWSGESSLAIAAGVNVILSPKVTISLTKAGLMSASGHCKAFDAGADGYVRSEGVGVVVLKPLSQAQKNNDPIYAVIQGSAVNQDGRSNGLTAPNLQAQEILLSEAYRCAGFSLDSVQYIEAQGTGTLIGDALEMKALGTLLAKDRLPECYCAVGSVKTNIGHTEAASGIAGLIKVALSLKHRQIPPNLHFRKPNPYIHFDQLPLRVQQTLEPWPVKVGPARAGVSAFGLGGTNAHIVMEEAPLKSGDKRQKPDLPQTGAGETEVSDAANHSDCALSDLMLSDKALLNVYSPVEHPQYILTLGAKSENALRELACRYQEFLAHNHTASLADVCFTANTRRSQFNYRLVAITESTVQLRQQLSAFVAGQQTAGLLSGKVNSRKHPKIAFLFTGLDGPSVGMGRQLYETQPVFRQSLDRCNEILRPHLEKPLLEVLYHKSEFGILDQTTYTQPALFALQYGLAELWRSWGIDPTVLIGCDVGEYVAAYLAGVFSLVEALSLTVTRGRLIQSLPKGVMLAVTLPKQEVQCFLSEQLSLAAVNGFSLCVISGPIDAVEQLENQLAQKNVEVRRLNTSHAFHSVMMEPILESFAEQVKRVNLNPPQIPLISTVTGTWMTPIEAIDPNYWVRQLRQTVRFADGLHTLLQEPKPVLLEVGTGQTLYSLAQRHPDKHPEQMILSSVLHHSHDSESALGPLLNTLAQLWLAGTKVDWSSFYTNERRHLIPLPTYPFEHQSYWIHSFSIAQQLQEHQSPGYQPQIRHSRPQLENAYVSPRNDIEQKTAQIWQELLCIEPVGIHDSFLELGANSLMAAQVVSRLRGTFCVELPLGSLFETPTVAELAAVIAQSQAEKVEEQRITCLLAELDGLSDEEAQLLADEMH